MKEHFSGLSSNI